jgi:hypothetical protein
MWLIDCPILDLHPGTDSLSILKSEDTAQIPAKTSFNAFWAGSFAPIVVSSDLRRAQGSRLSSGYEKAV